MTAFRNKIFVTNRGVYDILTKNMCCFPLFGEHRGALMENHFYNTIIGELENFIKEQGFEIQQDGSYLNETKRFLIEYDENTKLYNLMLSEAEGEPEYAAVSSWSFDDERGEGEAKTIAGDFLDTLRTKLGVAVNRRALSGNVPLPKRSSSGQTPDVSAFCQRVLAVFPKYKDAYRDHVAKYGEFLYLKFFSETITVEIREALDSRNKKQLKKYFETLSEMYIEGDRNVQNAISVIIITAAIGDSQQRFETAMNQLEDCASLKNVVRHLYRSYMAKDKKLRAMIDG